MVHISEIQNDVDAAVAPPISDAEAAKKAARIKVRALLVWVAIFAPSVVSARKIYGDYLEGVPFSGDAFNLFILSITAFSFFLLGYVFHLMSKYSHVNKQDLSEAIKQLKTKLAQKMLQRWIAGPLPIRKVNIDELMAFDAKTARVQARELIEAKAKQEIKEFATKGIQ